MGCRALIVLILLGFAEIGFSKDRSYCLDRIISILNKSHLTFGSANNGFNELANYVYNAKPDLYNFRKITLDLMAFFREQYPVLLEMLKRNPVEQRWLDTVKHKTEFIYGCVKDLIGDPQFALHMVDTLRIPVDRKKAEADAKELLGTLNGRVAFMGFANDGKYTNVVNMPWKVVNTNADSVAGQTLVWRPLVTKFLFTEYTMYAEARKMNTIPMLVTVLVLLVTVALWWRKK
jgi:hypothetical protein